MGNKPSIAVINGSNINLLGIREPEIYGSETWEDIERRLKMLESRLHVHLLFFQSNHEGFIIDFIQEHLTVLDGAILNPAAFTKTGYGILDALQSVSIPYVEVHLSNIYSRELWHHESVFAPHAIGQIAGFRGFGYEIGLMAMQQFLSGKKDQTKGGN